jgi:hypothetical protein
MSCSLRIVNTNRTVVREQNVINLSILIRCSIIACAKNSILIKDLMICLARKIAKKN